MLADFVKATLIPGSLQFLLAGLAGGVALLHLGRRGRDWGRRWLTFLALLYLVLAMPWVSNALIAGVEPGFARLRTKQDARGARVVAVIGNGIVRYGDETRSLHQLARRTTFAVLEAARISELIEPSWIIASGGVPNETSQTVPESEAMRDDLVRLGIPAERILLESRSRNTAEQISNIATLIREKAILDPVVLVTTPAHARRVEMLATKERLTFVLGVATELRYDQARTGWWLLVPSMSALRGSETALYEYLAVVNTWLAD